MVLGTARGPVFGRTPPTRHRYMDALEVWLNEASVGPRAIARNVMFDHRVAQVREARFDDVSGHPRDAIALQEALVSYHANFVRTQRHPDFVLDEVNGSNVLAGGTNPRWLQRRDARLVRLISLNGLATKVLVWAGERGMEPFASRPTDSISGSWLDEHLSNTTSAAEFVFACLEALNAYAVENPFHPTWATLWDPLVDLLVDGADRACEALGIDCPVAGTWWIALQYDVESAGTLVRPTQLDAGWQAMQHFPSPPCAPLARGGHPVDLACASEDIAPLPEFIHRQILHPPLHWDGAGRWLSRTTRQTPSNVLEQRRAHHQRLALHYGSPVDAWMPSDSVI